MPELTAHPPHSFELPTAPRAHGAVANELAAVLAFVPSHWPPTAAAGRAVRLVSGGKWRLSHRCCPRPARTSQPSIVGPAGSDKAGGFHSCARGAAGSLAMAAARSPYASAPRVGAAPLVVSLTGPVPGRSGSSYMSPSSTRAPRRVGVRCDLRHCRAVMDNFERRGWICDGSGRTGGRESEYGRAPEVASDFVLYWASMAGVRALYAPGSGVRLRDGQAVNHFPNSAELVRKDMLVKNLKRYRRQLSQAGTPCPEIVPLTFYLPQDYGMLAEAFKRRPSKPWIAKPVGRAQGRGIFLVTRLSQLRQFRGGSTAASRLAASAGAAATSTAAGASSPSARSDASSGAGGGAASAAAFASDMYVLSRYIDRPLLIGGRKFDLRLYCLVTSFSPLRAYIHRQGFARFCAVPYSSSRADLADAAMHLTNVSVQVRNGGRVGAPPEAG